MTGRAASPRRLTGAPSPGGSADLLARASRVLAGSLHLDRLVDRLLEFLTPEHAVWSQVTIVAGRGWRRAAYRSARDSEVRRVDWLPPAGDPRSVAGVTASGRRAHLPAVEAGRLAGIAPAEAHEGLRPWLPCEALVLPLVARGGVFGALTVCAPDRIGGEHWIRVWEDLAERAALALDAARMFQDRRHALDVLRRDLHPPALPDIAGLDVAAFHRAADAAAGLGGDFYDVHGDPSGWTVVLGDVAGKGVEAAVLAGRARQIIRTAALVDRRPDAVLGLLHRVLASDGESGESFITAVCARLRPARADSWTADVAAAGHPPPLVLRRGGAVDPVAASGALLGFDLDPDYRVAGIELSPGDTLVFMTDGVLEARDRSGEEFGSGRVVELARDMAGAQPEAIVSHLAWAALEWAAASSPDDIALLAVRVQEP